MIGRQRRTRHRTFLGKQHPLDDLDQEEDMTPIFLLLVATLPSALGQCTTSKCQKKGYVPPRWENGALYLESLLSQTSERMIKAVQEALESRLVAQTASLETRLVAQTASLAAQTASLEDRLEDRLAAQTTALHEKIASLESRLTAATRDIGDLVTAFQNASCSAATRDIGDLVTAFQNASSQMAECCGRPVTTASPTVRPSTTPTTAPSTTPTTTETPTTTPTTTETPTTSPATTETPTTTPATTDTPTTTPTTTETPTTTPTTTETHLPVVFLRRQDGTVDFYRDWAAYKSGFGNQAGEFWLGLDTLHNLTTHHNYSLRVDLEDWSGETKWAEYSTFRVAGEADGYRLMFSGYSSDSTAGDGMRYYNNGQRFSTRDRDNDRWSGGSCAVGRQGGWWYGGCTYANPTGPYKPAGYRGDPGMYWMHAYGDYRSFKRVTLTLVLA